jgi:hypothetical protein
MPEICLGIGYERGEYGGLTRDWLYWYDENNQRYPTPAEQIKQIQSEATTAQTEPIRVQSEALQVQIQVDRERQRSEKLAAKLRSLGIDPDEE